MTDIVDRDLIAQFILSWRARGHFLPYDDYSVIDGWLSLGADTDSLIRALSELLPGFYGNDGRSKHPPPLRLIEQKIAKKIAKDGQLTNGVREKK